MAARAPLRAHLHDGKRYRFSLTPGRLLLVKAEGWVSNDLKRLVSWVGAAVITVLLVGVYLEQWWTALGFFLLVGLALNAVLGGSVVRIEGKNAWGKFGTAIVVGAAVAGAFWGLIVPDASWGVRLVALVVSVVIAAVFLAVYGTVLDVWQNLRDRWRGQ